jgi:hypothetical protein
MRLATTDTVAGYPAVEARDFIRSHDYKRAEDDHPLALALAAEGYLERQEPYGWVATLQGGALGNAKFIKPITRAKAEAIVAEAIERAKAVNADPKRYLYRVKRLRVFGSYLDPSVDLLGDVDMAIETERNERLDKADTGSFSTLCQRHSRRYGPQSLNTFAATLLWPEREVVQVVKGRVRSLSLTTEDPTKFTDRVETIYEA